ESGTGSETGGEDKGLCGGWELEIDLVGSMSMAGGRENFVFPGQSFEETSPGVWQLDSCPCGAACDESDPYTFTMTFFGEGAPAFPNMPMCPQIELYRDVQCSIAAVVVRDLADESAPVWWAAKRDEVVPGF